MSLSGLTSMQARLDWAGGTVQNDRNVNSKYKSFLAALENSYQSETITLENGESWDCLINPSRLTEEYDTKVLSIDFDSGVAEGDVFYWDRTGFYWIITLQQHTEEAYFRATINRCDQQVEINDEWYWVSLRGPVETDFEWWSKHGLTSNNLNYSIKMVIKKNSVTVNYFQRGQIIKLRQAYPDADTGDMIYDYHNWMVAATDKYSEDTTIEVYLTEEYDNQALDVMEEEIDQEDIIDTDEAYIDGNIYVDPYDTDLTYTVANVDNMNGSWSIDDEDIAEITSSDEETCTLDILASQASSFTLTYTYTVETTEEDTDNTDDDEDTDIIITTTTYTLNLTIVVRSF